MSSSPLVKSVVAKNPEVVEKECEVIQKIIKECYSYEPHTFQDGTKLPLSSTLYKKYNIFTAPSRPIYEIYYAIRNQFREIHPTGEYMLEGWLNYYTKDFPCVKRHSHDKAKIRAYHGFYVVKSPPNKPTTYYFYDGTVESVESIPGLLVIGPSGIDEHESTPVEGEEVRITIAFNVIPIETLLTLEVPLLNHFIPV